MHIISHYLHTAITHKHYLSCFCFKYFQIYFFHFFLLVKNNDTTNLIFFFCRNINMHKNTPSKSLIPPQSRSQQYSGQETKNFRGMLRRVEEDSRIPNHLRYLFHPPGRNHEPPPKGSREREMVKTHKEKEKVKMSRE